VKTDMERRLQELLDVGEGADGDEDVSSYLASDDGARAEAEQLSRIDAGLRALGEDPSESSLWEASAAAVLEGIDRSLEELEVEAPPLPDAPDEGYRRSNATFGMRPVSEIGSAPALLSRWPIFAAVAACALALGTWYAGDQSEIAVQEVFADETDNAVAATTASEPVIATLRGDRGVMGLVGDLRDAGVALHAPRGPRPHPWMARLRGAPGVYPMRVEGADLTFYFLAFEAEEDAAAALAEIEVSQASATAWRRAGVVLFVNAPAGAAELGVVERVTAAFRGLEASQ